MFGEGVCGASLRERRADRHSDRCQLHQSAASRRRPRDAALRFSNGHFTMIGLRVNDKPLLRAYSIVSANYEDHLEFLSIKVPHGPLTSRLQHVRPGDKVIVGRKPTGTLVLRKPARFTSAAR